MEKLRQDYKANISSLEVEKLHFLDEAGITLSMTRMYGRAARGERVVDAVPHSHWETTSLIAALGINGVIAPMSIEGAIDGDVFLTYVERVLAPTLEVGDIVLMDNLKAHKVAGVEQAIKHRGAALIYLPPYSPDYSPIEQCWSKIKSILRSAAARTPEALEQAVSDAFASITTADAAGWFSHCGYFFNRAQPN